MNVLATDQIARICHEVNRAYCIAQGDNSQVPWDDAPENIRASAVAGVQAAVNDPEATPESMHKSWLAFKEADGWVWGPEKDASIKTHPCMKEYSLLPEPQKMKDHLFLAVVRAAQDL